MGSSQLCHGLPLPQKPTKCFDKVCLAVIMGSERVFVFLFFLMCFFQTSRCLWLMRSEKEALAGEEATHTCSTPDCLITRRISLYPWLNLGVNPVNGQTCGRKCVNWMNYSGWCAWKEIRCKKSAPCLWSGAGGARWKWSDGKQVSGLKNTLLTPLTHTNVVSWRLQKDCGVRTILDLINMKLCRTVVRHECLQTLT